MITAHSPVQYGMLSSAQYNDTKMYSAIVTSYCIRLDRVHMTPSMMNQLLLKLKLKLK